MKKILVITAFAVAISLPAVFGTGRFEIRTQPVYDQQRAQERDQQWRQSQENQRWQQQQMERDRQNREAWQRAQWQRDRDWRNNRHERTVTYEFWLQSHQRDYDNRNRN